MVTTNAPIENVLNHLEGVRRNGTGGVARCPVHDDRHASLSITEGDDGKVLLHCHAGCTTESIVSTFPNGWKDTFPEKPPEERARIVATYDYRDESGRVGYTVCRKSNKEFVQRRLVDGRLVWNLQGVQRLPFHLAELLDGVKAGRRVIVVEGEKDVLSLEKLGFVATCNSGGAGKWRPEFRDYFAGARVAVLPDIDKVGRDHAAEVAASLHDVVADIRVLELPGLGEHGDVSDWIAQGGTADELKALIEACPDVGTLDFNSVPAPVPNEGVHLVRASSITMQRPEWADELRIPIAGVTLVAGTTGMGKTIVLGERAARLTCGELPGRFFGRPTDVVYMGVEDDPAAILVPRLVAAGADLTRVHFVQVAGGYPFEVAADLARLDELLGELDEVSLVVIDPLDAHLGGAVDTHRKAEVQSVIGRLAVLAQKYRCGVVGIAHLSKGDTRDLLARIIGSVAFTTSVRSVLGIGEHPEAPAERVMVLAKSNLTDKAKVPALRFRLENALIDHDDGGTIDTARVVWLGEEMGLDPDSIVRIPDSAERTERDEAAEWIEASLADGPVPYKQLERQSREDGISRATLHRAKRALGIVVTRDEAQRGRPSVWSLPVWSQSLRHSGETKSNPNEIGPETAIRRVSSHETPLCDETPPETTFGICVECNLRPATKKSGADRPWCATCWDQALGRLMQTRNEATG